MNHRKNHSQLFVLIAITILAVIISACAPAASRQETEPMVGEAVGEVANLPAQPEPQLSSDEAAGEPMAEAPASEGEAPGADFAAAPAEERAAAALPPTSGAGGVAAQPMPTAMPAQAPDQQFVANLTAGEVDDNADFEAYLQYRTDYGRFVGFGSVHDFDVSERYIVRVQTRSGLPMLGARVTIYAGQNLVTSLQTPATGAVYFFPRAYPAAGAADRFNVTVDKGQAASEFELVRGQQAETLVTLDAAASQPPVALDVLFLIDATGSMADEIDQLKNNILSISAQIEALPSRPDVRFGMVTYRDRGDMYTREVYDFRDNVQAFQRDLQNVYAAGGGDTPEALNEALHSAIWEVGWRVEDTVSLMFLVADAPPHLDYPQDFDYAQEMLNAAQLGIKIFPISSELDDSYYQSQAEYIFRQLALTTGGHFIFLTYDSQPQSSGEPGRSDVSVPEGSYTVEDLDALVVRLIQDELAALSGGQ